MDGAEGSGTEASGETGEEGTADGEGRIGEQMIDQYFSVRVEGEATDKPRRGDATEWPDGIYKSIKDTGAVVIVNYRKFVFIHHNGVSFSDKFLTDGYVLLRKGERFTLTVG